MKRTRLARLTNEPSQKGCSTAMSRARRRLAVGAFLLVTAGALFGSGPSYAAPTYRDPLFRWSITVPDDWRVDASDATSVSVTSPDHSADVSVNIGQVRAADVDELAEDLVAAAEDMAQQRGVNLEILSFELGELADETPFVEVDSRFGDGDGGRSVMRLFLVDHTAMAVIGEAAEARWPGVEGILTAIVRSFQPGESGAVALARERSLSRGAARIVTSALAVHSPRRLHR